MFVDLKDVYGISPFSDIYSYSASTGTGDPVIPCPLILGFSFSAAQTASRYLQGTLRLV